MKFIFEGNDSSRDLVYEIKYYDCLAEGTETFEMVLKDKLEDNIEYEFSFDYDIKKEKIVTIVLLNENLITSYQSRQAHRYFSLLNEEIKKVCSFMLSMF